MVSAWSGYDDLDNWRCNISNAETLEQLRTWGWYPFVDIEYRYNSQGFRDEEFRDTECGIALGCSFTEGVGVAADQTWPSRLQSILGVKIWNLGIGGTGIATCYRAMDHFITRLRPKFVAMLDPPIARIEICRADSGFTHLLNIGWEHSDATSPQDQFIRHWFAQDFNWIHQHRVYVSAMQHLAQQHGVKFVHLYNGPICQPDPEYKEPENLIVDRGRDLAHAGPETLGRTAKIMADLLDS